MKRLLIIVLLFSVLSSLFAQTLDSLESRKNYVKYNFAPFLTMTLSGYYERVFENDHSIQLGYFNSIIEGIYTDWYWQGINIDYKIPIKTTHNSRLYYGISTRWLNYVESYDYDDDLNPSFAKFNNFSGGLIVGKDWFLGESNRLVFDCSLAIGYQDVNKTIESDDSAYSGYAFPATIPIMVKIGLNIGFGF